MFTIMDVIISIGMLWLNPCGADQQEKQMYYIAPQCPTLGFVLAIVITFPVSANDLAPPMYYVHNYVALYLIKYLIHELCTYNSYCVFAYVCVFVNVCVCVYACMCV